jgi:hypothetical protein
LQEEEMRALFNEGISGQFGKAKKANAERAAKLGIAEANPDILQIIEEKFGSDSDSDSDSDDDDGPYYVTEDEPTSVEVFREKTIEDIIEEQRAKLAAEGKILKWRIFVQFVVYPLINRYFMFVTGKQGTPITAESFAAWRTAKLAKKQAEAEARALAELSKKKGSKGLCEYIFFVSYYCIFKNAFCTCYLFISITVLFNQ